MFESGVVMHEDLITGFLDLMRWRCLELLIDLMMTRIWIFDMSVSEMGSR